MPRRPHWFWTQNPKVFCQTYKYLSSSSAASRMISHKCTSIHIKERTLIKNEHFYIELYFQLNWLVFRRKKYTRIAQSPCNMHWGHWHRHVKDFCLAKKIMSQELLTSSVLLYRRDSIAWYSYCLPIFLTQNNTQVHEIHQALADQHL